MSTPKPRPTTSTIAPSPLNSAVARESSSINPSRQPLISVIIPVYNVAKLLECCVNSVLAQTYQNLEIILVDDGSTDMSGKFCDVFAKKDPRIKVIHQENRGLSGARNAGLDLAAGEFVTFIDSDDSVDPNLIARLYSLCRNNRAKMSICAFREVFPQPSEVLKQSPQLSPSPIISQTLNFAPSDGTQALDTLDALTAMLCEVDFSMSAWGKLYARELFDTDPSACPNGQEGAKTTVQPSTPIRFPEGMLHEDVGTTYKLIINAKKIIFTPKQLYNYHQNPGSITQQSFSMKKLDLIVLTEQMCDDLCNWGAELVKQIQIAQSSSTQAPSSPKLPPNPAIQIKNLTKKRRAHARFSILRQMILIDPKALPADERQQFLETRREIVKYLRKHKNDVLKNPLASRRDRLAMLSLLAGLSVFRRAWLTYQNHKTKPKKPKAQTLKRTKS